MSTSVLVIDDNEQNLYLVRHLLEHRGYEVAAAGTGPIGLGLAGRLRPDLILLDLQLPETDACTVARRLKGDPATRAIPIIAVTSSATSGSCEQALAAGCDACVERPIDPATFVWQIESTLAGAPSAPGQAS